MLRTDAQGNRTGELHKVSFDPQTQTTHYTLSTGTLLSGKNGAKSVKAERSIRLEFSNDNQVTRATIERRGNDGKFSTSNLALTSHELADAVKQLDLSNAPGRPYFRVNDFNEVQAVHKQLHRRVDTLLLENVRDFTAEELSATFPTMGYGSHKLIWHPDGNNGAKVEMRIKGSDNGGYHGIELAVFGAKREGKSPELAEKTAINDPEFAVHLARITNDIAVAQQELRTAKSDADQPYGRVQVRLVGDKGPQQRSVSAPYLKHVAELVGNLIEGKDPPTHVLGDNHRTAQSTQALADLMQAQSIGFTGRKIVVGDYTQGGAVEVKYKRAGFQSKEGQAAQFKHANYEIVLKPLYSPLAGKGPRFHELAQDIANTLKRTAESILTTTAMTSAQVKVDIEGGGVMAENVLKKALTEHANFERHTRGVRPDFEWFTFDVERAPEPKGLRLGDESARLPAKLGL